MSYTSATMSRPTQTEDEKQLLARIDTAVNRIRKTIRVELPYYLTGAGRETAIRSAPYNWHKDSFFEKDEEHLQYSTWVYREDAEDLATLIIHGGMEEQRRRDEKAKRLKPKETRRDKPKKVAERIAREGSASSGDDRGKSKPGSPKKKISLAEYKKKKLGGRKSPEPSAATEARKSKVEERDAKATAGPEREKTNGVASSSRIMQQESRRNRNKDSKIDEFEIEPVKTEKPRREDDRKERGLQVPPAKPAPKHSSSPFDIPELHSPIDLGDAPKSPLHGIPPLLSPLHGLPSAFQRDLEAHKARQKRSAEDSKDHDMEKPAEKRVETARDRTDSDLSNASTNSIITDKAEEKKKAVAKAVESQPVVGASGVKRSAEKSRHDEEESGTLIVRLAYGKKRRSDVDRILRTRSDSKVQLPLNNEKKSSGSTGDHKLVNGTTSHNKPQSDTKSTTDHKVGTPMAKKQPAKGSTFLTPNNKRARDDEAAEPASNKRQQADPPSSNTSNKPKFQEPSTPRSKNDRLSPLPLTATKRPPTSTTKPLPKSSSTSSIKDLKATAMARNDSQESVDSGPRTTQVTPVPSSRVTSTPQPSSQSNGTGSGAKAAPLWKMNEELGVLGKQLKVIFDDTRKRVLQASEGEGPAVSKEEKRRGAVAGLESLCAYILMFTCRDTFDKLTNRPASASRFSEWHSILPLFNMVTYLTRSDPALNGLHAHLGVGIASRILTRWTELSRESRSSDRKLVGDKLTAQDVLDNAIRELPGWAIEARDLDLEKVMEAFPETWAGRRKGRGEGDWETDLLAKATNLLDKAGKEGKMFASGVTDDEGRGFSLPLAADSSPVQVAGFATAILREYVKKEGLDYSVQVRV